MLRIFLIFFFLNIIEYSSWHSESLANSRVPIPKIRLATVNAEYSGVITIADSMSFFKKQGIEVRIEQDTSGVVAAEKLLSQTVDLATCSETVVTHLALKNHPVRILAVLDRYENLKFIMSNSVGYTKPSDLKGKRIGLRKTSQAEIDLTRFCILNHIPMETISIVDVPIPEMEDALRTGKVDVIAVWTPIAHTLEKNLKGQVTSIPGQSGQKHYWVLIGLEHFVKENPAFIERFLRALLESEEYIHDNEETAKQIIAKQIGLSIEELNEFWASHDINLELNQGVLLEMEDQARLLLSSNATSHPKIPNLLNYFCPLHMRKIKPDAVWLIR